jgi:hypothetical protein
MVSRSAFVRSSSRKNDRRHRVAQHAGADRVALGAVCVEEAFRRCAFDHLRQLPSQVHRILHAGLETLAIVGGCTCAASPAISTRPLR